MNNRIEAAYEQRPRRWVFELAVALVVAALLIWSGTAVETAGTTQNGAVIAWNILAGIFHPDTDLLFNFTTQGVPYLLLETICIAFLGTIVGAIISIPLAFLSASNLTPKPVAFWAESSLWRSARSPPLSMGSCLSGSLGRAPLRDC